MEDKKTIKEQWNDKHEGLKHFLIGCGATFRNFEPDGNSMGETICGKNGYCSNCMTKLEIMNFTEQLVRKECEYKGFTAEEWEQQFTQAEMIIDDIKKITDCKSDDGVEIIESVENLRADERNKLIEEIEKSGILNFSHYYCEDCWYTCPKHPEGSCNKDAGTECICGADKRKKNWEALKKKGES
jgi:hypothetical protein